MSSITFPGRFILPTKLNPWWMFTMKNVGSNQSKSFIEKLDTNHFYTPKVQLQVQIQQQKVNKLNLCKYYPKLYNLYWK